MLVSRIRLYSAWIEPFLAWWMLEVRQIFSPLLQYLEAEISTVRLDLKRDCVVISALSVEASETMAQTNIASSFLALDATQIASLQALTDRRDIQICLPSSDVCVLKLHCVGTSVPTSESVKYRLLQESPLDVSQIAFTWRFRPAPKGTKSDEPSLEVAICRSDYLARIQELAACYGLSPSVIGFALSESGAPDFTFPLPRVRRMALSIKAHRNVLLALGALFMPVIAMITIGVIASVDANLTRGELDRQLAILQGAEGMMREHAALGAVSGDLARQATRPSLVNAINDLGRLVPEDTWMSEIRYDGKTLYLVGMSRDPAAATKALAPSKLLGDVRLSSVTTPNPSTPISQFEVTSALLVSP